MTMALQPLKFVVLLTVFARVISNPQFKPYIAYRTSPTNDTLLLNLSDDVQKSRPSPFDKLSEKTCPGQLKIGIAKRLHEYHEHNPGMAIRHPVVLHHVGHSRGKQVVYTTQYEHLDVLHSTPLKSPGQTLQNALIQATDFPLLLESSSFHTSPIVHDVNGDGMEDAIVADYDGGIYVMGLDWDEKRYFHRTQVPRLFVRKDWVEQRVHEILGTKPQDPPKEDNQSEETSDSKEPPHDPYHTYFEYYYAGESDNEGILRGVTSNVLKQDTGQSKGLAERRGRRVQHTEQEADVEQNGDNFNNYDGRHRRLQENAAEHHHDQEQELLDHAHGSAKRQHDNVEQENNEHHREPEHHEEHHQEPERHEVHHQEPEHHEEHRQEPEHHEVRHQEPEFHEEHRQEPERHEEYHHQEPDPRHEDHQEPDRHQGSQQHQEEIREAEQNQVNNEAVHHEEAEQHQEEHRETEFHHEEQHRESAQHQEHEQHHDEHRKPELREESQPRHDENRQNLDHQDHESHHTDTREADHRHEENRGREDAEEPNYHREDDHLANFDRVEHDDDFDTMDDLMREGDHVLDDDSFEEFDKEEFEKELAREHDDHVDDDHGGRNEDGEIHTDDPEYGLHHYAGDDDYRRYEHDDMYGGGYNDEHNEYYDGKHYIRVPPHILCTPVMAELPKLYGDANEKDLIIFVAVSYYLDEDEYEGFFSYKRFQDKDKGDDTELKRGHYVGSAIMSYILGDASRWSSQVHLDLSTDWSAPENATIVGALEVHPDMYESGAFALSSPTIADIDGDGNPEAILGTSMGMIYVFDARSMNKRDKWPVQLKYPVETRILVEDVVGDTNLELFVGDVAGNLVCLNHDGGRIWNRNLPLSVGHGGPITGSSPLTMGDVDGDGHLDIVRVIHFDDVTLVFAVNAATGKDVPNFPIQLDKKSLPKTANPDELHKQLAQPLLVDLHSDQSFLLDYIRRKGAPWQPRRRSTSSTFGSAPGLHIVQPLGEDVYVVEAGSGCSHKIAVGAPVSAMVQVDDVHGKDLMDLVVATETGKIVTFETTAPFHALNSWSSGELRSSTNALAHGYSASQGIFVHSREFSNIFGVVVPIQFEIFDNRPNIASEPDKQVYKVEIRAGTSGKRTVWRGEYNKTGIYTERVYIRYGPGYYAMSVVMFTSHGLVYEDSFSVGYNVFFMQGFGLLLWFPLVLVCIAVFLCGAKKTSWEDADDDDDRGGGQGILGRSLPS